MEKDGGSQSIDDGMVLAAELYERGELYKAHVEIQLTVAETLRGILQHLKAIDRRLEAIESTSRYQPREPEL